jgi:hypothetical protein
LAHCAGVYYRYKYADAIAPAERLNDTCTEPLGVHDDGGEAA